MRTHNPDTAPSLDCRIHDQCIQRRRAYNREWYAQQATDPKWREQQAAKERVAWRRRTAKEMRRCWTCGVTVKRHSLLGCYPRRNG